jgi:class 3 adenylate cyclase
MVILLVVSLGSTLVIGYLSWQSSRNALMQQAFNHLTSVRASKARQIEGAIQNLYNDLAIVTKAEGVIAAMVRFNKAYKQLDNELIPATWDEAIDKYYVNDFFPRLVDHISGTSTLAFYGPVSQASHYLQYHYMAANERPVGKKHLLDDAGDGSEYSKIHKRYHPIFRELVERAGYHDLFLIDFDTQDVVYTVSKEVDFTTNLNDGPYADSGLTKVVKMVRDHPQVSDVKAVDFTHYTPSDGAPAAFFATPIFNGPHIVGIFALQLSIDEINQVMTSDNNWQETGLGDSGETFLIGSDLLMRSDSRFLIQDPEGYEKALHRANMPQTTIDTIKKFGTSILLHKIDAEATRAVTKGEAGARIVNDYRGIPVLNAYAPLQIEGFDWNIITKMDLEEVMRPIRALQRSLLIATAIIVLVVVILSIMLPTLFMRPINALVAGAQKVMAGEQDVVVEIDSHDELGQLARTFNNMVENLQQQNELLAHKSRENDALLLNVLPQTVADQVRRGESQVAERIQQVTLVSATVLGFTELAASEDASQGAALLNEWVDSFDQAAETYGLERYSIIGERYLAVCGLMTPLLDNVSRACDFALETFNVLQRFNLNHKADLRLRIGMHTGPLMAGIVGIKRFRYGLWGETLNIVTDLQIAAEPGTIVVSQAVYDRVHDLYLFEPRDRVAIPRFHTEVAAWLLRGVADRTTASPDPLAVAEVERASARVLVDDDGTVSTEEAG